jgi:hypothetical protein
MAFLFTAASSQYLIGTYTGITAEPLTIACWYRGTTTADVVLATVGSSTGAGHWRLRTQSGIAAQRIDNAVVNTSATAGSSITAGVWRHGAATFAPSGGSITAWSDGVAGTPVTNPGTALTGVDRITIGMRLFNGTPGTFANGDIAEVGVWSGALTADEIAGLAKGFRCRMIRPQSLRFDLRMIRNLQDLSGGVAITNTNGATVSTHPRIIYP